ncbi:MAG: hypothetical protein EBS19_14680, partial [Spirochaetia bacterium]|nr:hypothetical protein [Spirochaetia bacterium]
NQMTGLREGCMAAWDKNEFFQFFTPMINESIDYEERDLVLEKAYITYELGVMYENNQDWFIGGDKIYSLVDPETNNAILFKNGKLHILQQESIESLSRGELVNESWLSAAGDFFGNVYSTAKKYVKQAASAVNKYVIQPVKQAATYVAKKVKQGWEYLSDGARKVWEFSKKIASAVVTFIKENPLTAIGIALQILGTILSFIPVVQFLSPILAMIAGGITVYEGVTNLISASKETSGAKSVPDIVRGGGKIIFGSASLILGIKDLVASASESLPGMGSVGIAIKTGVTTWATKFSKTIFGSVASVGVGKALKCSSWLAEFFVTLCEKAPFVQKIPKGLYKAAKTGIQAAEDKGKDVILDNEEYVEEWNERIDEGNQGSWGFGELLVNFMAYVGKSCFSWLYDAVIGAVS